MVTEICISIMFINIIQIKWKIMKRECIKNVKHYLVTNINLDKLCCHIKKKIKSVLMYIVHIIL